MKNLTSICFVLLLIPFSFASAEEYLNGIEWNEPAIITPGKENSDPPSDAVVLFDGTDKSKWKDADSWKVEVSLNPNFDEVSEPEP